jgi:hypothetical protein
MFSARSGSLIQPISKLSEDKYTNLVNFQYSLPVLALSYNPFPSFQKTEVQDYVSSTYNADNDVQSLSQIQQCQYSIHILPK